MQHVFKLSLALLFITLYLSGINLYSKNTATGAVEGATASNIQYYLYGAVIESAALPEHPQEEGIHKKNQDYQSWSYC